MDNTSRIRILHCIHDLSGGGAQRQLSLLASASRDAGMDAAIFCVCDSLRFGGFEGAQIIKSKQKNSKDPVVFLEVSKAIRAFKPDVIHVWLPPTMTVPAMVMAARHHIPVILSFRNEMRFRRVVYYPEYICALLIASGIVTNNPVRRSGRPYRFLYRMKHGCHIPNAVSATAGVGDRKNGLLQPRSRNDALRLLFVGSLTQTKNWRCLINALPLIDTEYKWHLTICGDGPDREALCGLVREQNLTDRVDVLGYFSNVYDTMNRSDLLVMPSWYEGMPNVLMEALALGLPCIASDIPAVQDLTNERPCILTFDPHSSEKLANLISQVAAAPSTLAPLREKGLKLAEAFSVERMVRAYRDYYFDALKRSSLTILTHAEKQKS